MHILPKLTNETNREYATRIIRNNIISLDITPGSMIGEQEIADQLKISRTPVHEALLELSKSKIVDILPQKGCHVSLIDSEYIEEAVFIRSTMETAIVGMACKEATPADIIKLEENVKLQEFYLSQNQPDKIMELDNQFHEYLYKICNKMQCYYMVNLMSIHFDRLRNLSVQTIKNLKIVNDHKEISTAIRNHDGPKAKELLKTHLSRQEIDQKIIREQYPQYFKT
ncbi:MAG: GntR family transcriptional regulator [Spirochaetaceae bacterium]|nr:GntR family transcriptional regulator [Spirochaetaceae bacterium]